MGLRERIDVKERAAARVRQFVAEKAATNRVRCRVIIDAMGGAWEGEGEPPSPSLVVRPPST
jgi:hypothetical protein